MLGCSLSGHLLSTAEVESALVEHEAVAEAAVVGRPHPVKGESLYCFVTLAEGVTYNHMLETQLKKQGWYNRVPHICPLSSELSEVLPCAFPSHRADVSEQVVQQLKWFVVLSLYFVVVALTIMEGKVLNQVIVSSAATCKHCFNHNSDPASHT